MDDLWKHLASEQGGGGHWAGLVEPLLRTKGMKHLGSSLRAGSVLSQTPPLHSFARKIYQHLPERHLLFAKKSHCTEKESLKKQANFMNPESLISRNITSSTEGPRLLQAP